MGLRIGLPTVRCMLLYLVFDEEEKMWYGKKMEANTIKAPTHAHRVYSPA